MIGTFSSPLFSPMTNIKRQFEIFAPNLALLWTTMVP